MQLSPSVRINSEAELEFLEVNAPFCQAKIYLQGGQIVSFIPKGKPDLLWCFNEAVFLAGKSIRGGIPICWPWFGAHEQADFPQHGFARTAQWRAEEVNESKDQIEIVLSLPSKLIPEALWPYKTNLEVKFFLSDSLHIELITTNLDSQPLEFSQALHTYFPTSSIHHTHVSGFDGCEYVEFGEIKMQTGDIHFTEETDRVFDHLNQKPVITTPEGQIALAPINSCSAVVWNPWIEKSKRLSHFANEDYQNMLCVETANVREDKVYLEPLQAHTLGVKLSWLS